MPRAEGSQRHVLKVGIVLGFAPPRWDLLSRVTIDEYQEHRRYGCFPPIGTLRNANTASPLSAMSCAVFKIICASSGLNPKAIALWNNSIDPLSASVRVILPPIKMYILG